MSETPATANPLTGQPQYAYGAPEPVAPYAPAPPQPNPLATVPEAMQARPAPEPQVSYADALTAETSPEPVQAPPGAELLRDVLRLSYAERADLLDLLGPIRQRAESLPAAADGTVPIEQAGSAFRLAADIEQGLSIIAADRDALHEWVLDHDIPAMLELFRYVMQAMAAGKGLR
ncbi:hypothetical protein [Sciscionella sediminilitoris]|uniref:hypothetical protein n=1 Tax=Sciscionella sediminilitoris TaxID=1445613 RepID=UPI0004DFA547|nr:hypothetical protein [Sciscionella sp. SE31]